jgi:hypothetical protein
MSVLYGRAGPLNKPFGRFSARAVMDYMPHSAFLQNPLIVDKAEGLYYWDVNGKQYFDGIGGAWPSHASQTRIMPGVESFFSQGVQEGRKPLRILHLGGMELCNKTPRGFNHCVSFWIGKKIGPCWPGRNFHGQRRSRASGGG